MEAAEQAFEQALDGELAPQQRIETLLYLARIALRKSDFDSADAHAAEALRLLDGLEGDTFEPALVALSIRREAALGRNDTVRADQFQQRAAALALQRERRTWDRGSVTGGLVHRNSGMILPEAVAGLAEARVLALDGEGWAGAVSYAADERVDPESGEAGGYVTVYIAQAAEGSLTEQFDAATRDIEAHEGTREITEAPIMVQKDGRRLSGRMAVYMTQGGAGSMITTVHLFRFAPDVQIRFLSVYSSAEASVMRERVSALMQTMVWPGGDVLE
jgi:hypothetical protein